MNIEPGVRKDKVSDIATPSVIITICLMMIVLLACLLTNTACAHKSDELSFEASAKEPLPQEIIQTLDRFTFINTATGDTLVEYRVLGITRGTYEQGGAVFDTCVVSFEDRYGGAEADMDFLDVIVELKRARTSNSTTVRIVHLGLDTIDVYVDGKFLQSVRPAIEIQITSPPD